MRVVFIGAVDFSRHCLQEILQHEAAEVVGVYTLPAEKATFNADYADLRPVAAEHGVPVHQVEDINAPQHVEQIRKAAPDVIFVFGFSRLVSAEILDIPPGGCIGSHPAPLPKGRGRHPLIWTLVKGLDEGALTFFYLGEEADTGDILWQESFPVTLADDAGTLYEKIEGLATDALREFLPQLAAGTAPRRSQDDDAATHWRKRGYADGQIDWRAPAMQTYNLVRALTRPYVGAHTRLGGQDVKVWRAALPEDALPEAAEALPPGTIFERAEPAGEERPARLAVRTGDGHLLLAEYDAPPGARPLQEGTRLES